MIAAAFCLCMVGYGAGIWTAYQTGFAYRNTLRLARLIIPYRPEQERMWVMQTELLRETPPVGEVTFLGDSLTAFADWRALFPGVAIQNRGLGGETSSGLRMRVARGEPILPVVVVMIGVNDHARGVPISETKANLRAIVQMLKGKRIILQSTLLTSYEYSNAVVRELDEYQAQLCKDGACTFLDLNPAMSQGGKIRPEFVIDGIHLNWRGYEAWAARIRPLLNAIIDGENAARAKRAV
jgi:lysophospholipase L1-like esterase